MAEDKDECVAWIPETEIQEVLDYLWDDEERDYLANRRAGHVFRRMKVIAAWLKWHRHRKPTA